MHAQAKRELVESYKRLRSEDAAPGSSTSYRITVRQLEALVRLSEALARLRCSKAILPSYVREVTRRIHPNTPALPLCSSPFQLPLRPNRER
jgi:DNA replication licensing factor MCM6